jgi:predicted AlkP superfamily phosphohydrolase/phosphomutase
MDTIVIGIDGGEWDIIAPLIADGSLPNLARLREKGMAGDLASATPPVSPPAWTSIHTGKNPGKHGIYDFNYYDAKYFNEDHTRHEQDEFSSSVIPQYYEIVDRAIGDILDATGEGTDLIVLSDHGFGPLEKDVRIDEWLADHGYLSRYGSESAGEARVKLLSRGIDLVWSTVERLGIADEVKSVLPKEVVLSGGQMRNKTDRSINWEASKAFFTNLSGQAILINIEGKYASGSVSDDEYEAVVTSLQEELCGLRDPSTDERIVLNVHHKSDVYEGDASDDAPDLVVETHPKYTLTEGPSKDLVKPSRQYGQDRSGDHRENGIFIGAGASFASGTLESGSIVDIAPTLLHLHGLAVPTTMDGDVLTDALDVDREVTHTSGYEDAEIRNRDWTDEEQDELTERLENMGYIN